MGVRCTPFNKITSAMRKHTEVQTVPLAAIRLVGGIFLAILGFLAILFTVLVLGGAEEPTRALLIVAGMASLLGMLVLLMRTARMYVIVDDTGVFVRFFPFQVKGRFIPWSEVQQARLRPVRAIGEFGGWGLRWTFGNKMGYIWDGTTGLELRLHTGRTIVITLTQPEAVEAFLDMPKA